MKFFQANMQTGILVLLVILVGILCIALFITNKEVRNIKAGVVKSRHDIAALQTLLNDVGLTATGGRLDIEDLPDNIIDRGNAGPPTSQFPINGLPPNVDMFPPCMLPPGFNPLDTLDEKNEKETENPNRKVSEDLGDPFSLPAKTDAEPATLNLENPIKQDEKDAKDVIPAEDIEEVNEPGSKKQPKKSPKPQTKKTNEAKDEDEENKEEESSEEESSEEESSDEDDE